MPHVRHSSTKHFDVVEHEARCAHTRDRPAGARPGHEHDLKLAVKQYVPKQNDATTEDSSRGSGSAPVTILAAHANGFPKEMYEPLWDGLYQCLTSAGHSIRSIWIADMYNQNASAALNAPYLGPDPSWFDHSRDLMKLVNDNQDGMPQPLIAVGHSIGGFHLAQLSLWHPRLFKGVVLLDPVIQVKEPSSTYAPASAYRRDAWPSRNIAAEGFRRSKFYQQWDPAVLDQWCKYGLRDAPETAEQGSTDVPVTLATPLEQEIYGFVRASFEDERMLQAQGTSTISKDMSESDKQIHYSEKWPFYRPEPATLTHQLPLLQPPVQYIFGETSGLIGTSDTKTSTTGTVVGGNGGTATGGTQSHIVQGAGHLVCFEKVEECARVVASFIETTTEGFAREQGRQKEVLARYPGKEWSALTDEWKAKLGPAPVRKPKPENKGSKL